MMCQSQFETTILSRVPPKSILLVEDAPDVAEAVSGLLLRLGHGIVHAIDGRKALEEFKPGKFDLVITDYSMPRMNGVELAEIIKRRAPMQPILMVTAFAFTLAAYDGRPLPVDAMLSKPFHARELNQTIEQLFSEKPVMAKVEAPE